MVYYQSFAGIDTKILLGSIMTGTIAEYDSMVKPQSLVYIRELELAQLMTRKQ